MLQQSRDWKNSKPQNDSRATFWSIRFTIAYDRLHSTATSASDRSTYLLWSCGRFNPFRGYRSLSSWDFFYFSTGIMNAIFMPFYHLFWFQILWHLMHPTAFEEHFYYHRSLFTVDPFRQWFKKISTELTMM